MRFGSRIRRPAARMAGTVVAAAAGAGVLGCGGSDAGGDHVAKGGPNPQPAFYMTAGNAADLKRRSYDAGARFARGQGPGRSVLVLDFGAARLRGGTHGVALRGGTFFSNAEVAAALEAAARGYSENRKRGSATMVYANSNALLSRPGRRYNPFDERTAREAGEQQARTVAGLDLPERVSATVGGDIEPGYDVFGKPEISIAMVAGANGATPRPYYNVGTAPCIDGKCVNGWRPEEICEVSSGRGRRVLPEVYSASPEDQPSQWAEIQRTCGIESFAGVSASPAGDYSPRESWQELRARTGARVDPVIVVFPG